jgi:hypothetical protein
VRPTPHVLDHFRLDLVLGQVQGEHGFLPGGLQTIEVQLGQFQQLTLRCAVGAADAGETLVQVAALEKRRHRAFDDRAPEAVLGRRPPS